MVKLSQIVRSDTNEVTAVPANLEVSFSNALAVRTGQISTMQEVIEKLYQDDQKHGGTRLITGLIELITTGSLEFGRRSSRTSYDAMNLITNYSELSLRQYMIVFNPDLPSLVLYWNTIPELTSDTLPSTEDKGVLCTVYGPGTKELYSELQEVYARKGIATHMTCAFPPRSVILIEAPYEN